MIRSLRQRHRRIAVVSGVLLPLSLIVGIAARRPAQGVSELPMAIDRAAPSFSVVDWERADLFPRTSARVRLVRDPSITNRFGIEISLPKDFARPDVLVYWDAGTLASTNVLPDEALLLGACGSPLPLPASVRAGAGKLLLYSLADREVLDASQSFTARQP
jgi:hypothetical protein